jgi:hypothetical protein
VTDQQQGDAVAAAGKLSGSLDAMSGELRRLNDYGRRSRHMILALSVSLALDLALTVIVAFFAVQAHNASNSATAAEGQARHAFVSSTALCQASNTARAQQLRLWDFLLNKSAKPESPLLKQFAALIDRDFAARDCAALGKKK